MSDDIATPAVAPPPGQPRATAYSWYVLGVLFLVYVLNFIDRYILSILAVDIQAHFDLSPQTMGFLGGAAFAVFFALFGIPLGRLADNWSRTRLLAIGLALWSGMTVVSGLVRTGGQLGIARMGVGIGEASAGPAAYSLISDYFPKHQRATALAIYSSGIYIGAGVSLLIGASISQWWNAAWPGGGPLGFVGWQAAFVAVGLPGLLVALWVASLREPVRGAMDGLPSRMSPTPFADFARELTLIVPPFTLIAAARRGPGALAVNVAVAAAAAVLAWGLVRVTGNVPQWTAIGIGYYAVFSWACALRRNDAPTFALMFGTPAFLCLALASGLAAMSSNGIGFWAPFYAESVLGLDKQELAFWLGGGAALGGFLGIIIGGRLADIMRARRADGRILVILLGVVAPVVPVWLTYNVTDKGLFYAFAFLGNVLGTIGIGAAAATTQDLVMPRMRGAATAAYFLSTTLVGLAFGPYLVGLVAELAGTVADGRSVPDMRVGILSALALVIPTLLFLWVVLRTVAKAEATVVERARAAGEVMES